MGLGIGLIVAVAALNIVASLILLVMEKTRDIAILKTMGASSRSVMLIFLIAGHAHRRNRHHRRCLAGRRHFQLPDRYRVISIPGGRLSGQLSAVPAFFLWDLTAIVVGAVIVCFFATLYPSRQAAKLDPAQALPL